MPVRLMPSAINREQVQLWVAKPVDFTVGTPTESAGRWRFVVDEDVYHLDPTEADSYGKTNFIYPSRTYPFDGNLATRGLYVSTNSTTWVAIDVGVDMSTPNRYLILWKFSGSATGGSTGYVGLFASEDMVTWTLLFYRSVGFGMADYFVLIKPVRCRALKAMAYNSVGGSYYTYLSTYELSLYKV